MVKQMRLDYKKTRSRYKKNEAKVWSDATPDIYCVSKWDLVIKAWDSNCTCYN